VNIGTIMLRDMLPHDAGLSVVARKKLRLNAAVRSWCVKRYILNRIGGKLAEEDFLMDSIANATHNDCRHHWVIEMPNGPVSHGQCKVCGMERDFYNNPEDARVGESQPVASAA
jgi:hypothetical protein